MRLDGKAALITGAAMGIGKVTAELFAAEGAAVLVVDWDRAAGLQTAREIERRGGRAAFEPADVSQDADARRAVQACVDRFGRIDVLFNNAGIHCLGTVETLDEAEFDRVMAINAKGPFLMCRHAIPHMRRQGGGSIINMGSTAALVAAVNLTAYGMSKAAVLGLTRALAADYAHSGIRANCLCPGATDTPLLARLMSERSEAEKQAFLAKNPLGRAARPEEIARAALFLASDDSSYVNGLAFAVDGGFTAV